MVGIIFYDEKSFGISKHEDICNPTYVVGGNLTGRGKLLKRIHIMAVPAP
jgi:hypothetical protein